MAGCTVTAIFLLQIRRQYAHIREAFLSKSKIDAWGALPIAPSL
jgi:hypothetical protein